MVGLDVEGRVTIANISAAQFLGQRHEKLIGRYLNDFIPELAGLLDGLTSRTSKLAQTHISLYQPGRAERSFLLRVTAESLDGLPRGYVATFDDLTELMAAQRKAAWADVARRIAHEIKNPLTPIQLSAERLKRKYKGEITSDPETFEACTDTIIRHVGDIGRMVDEFTTFARMPVPVIKPEDLNELCRKLTLSRGGIHANTAISYSGPETPVMVECDGRLIGQALTNLLQNGAEAIEGRTAVGGDLPPGEITVTLEHDDHIVEVRVADNGKGLPTQERDRLTEPYVTTRAKGTGLGLAIVRKIMEDHGGQLLLGDRPGGGAVVTLKLPVSQTVLN